MPHENGRASLGARFAAASLIALLAAGCGAAAPQMAPEAPASKAAETPTTTDDALAQLDRAELELDQLLPRREGYPSSFATPPGGAAAPPPPPSPYGQPSAAPAPTSPAKPAPADAAPVTAAPEKEARAMSQGEGADGCATACRALSSMRRAASHLCELAGDGDTRCDSAKTRVASAEERVRASCSDCEE